MLAIDVKVGDVLQIEGVGTVRVDQKSGQRVKLVVNMPDTKVELKRREAAGGLGNNFGFFPR